jgi:hypothetical protein
MNSFLLLRGPLVSSLGSECDPLNQPRRPSAAAVLSIAITGRCTEATICGWLLSSGSPKATESLAREHSCKGHESSRRGLNKDDFRYWHNPDMLGRSDDVCFSNRPFGVKHFQTFHHHSVDVARGLVLLFGIGTGAFPSWDSRTRRNNLLVGLAVEEQRVQADIRTHLIHRPARDIFPPLGGARVFSYRV